MIKPGSTEYTGGKLGSLLWDEANRAASLQIIFLSTCAEIHRAIDWYLPKIRCKRRWAQALRVGAILFGAAAGILPMLTQLKSIISIAPVWASIFLVLAATLLALDRFFGFSSGWMRFIVAEMQLQELAIAFQLDWEAARSCRKGEIPDDQEIQDLLALVKETTKRSFDIQHKETGEWQKEFQATLRETGKPGGRSGGGS